MINKIIIKNLDSNIKIEGCILIKNIEEKTAKNGKLYYQFTLSDGESDLTGNYFNEIENYKSLIGKIICITIKTQIYNGKFGCIIDSYDLSKEIDESQRKEFVKYSLDRKYYDEYRETLKSLIDSIEDLEVKSLCSYVFLDKYKRQFETYPAAKSNHHAGYGGLLEHSVNLANIALFFYEYYSYDYKLDRDLLIAGALFQDIGKIVEYDVDSLYNVTYSKLGTLKGHITISNEILNISLYELGLSQLQDKFAKLSHIILSHHGLVEMGSPIFPITGEAILISKIDALDATMKSLFAAIKSTKKDEDYTNRMFNLNNVALMMPDIKIYIEETPNKEDEAFDEQKPLETLF